MKYFLIAGERSGDLHGSNLIKALKKQDADADFQCWGGEMMEKAGAKLLHHYREIALMGIWEVITKIFTIFRYFKKCEQEIEIFAPDAVILIDFGGFNLRMAKRLHEHNVKTYYYITPKIWAWNRSRVYKIKNHVSNTFCILPFEKDFFEKYGCSVDYVGNPVVDAVKQFKPTKEKNELLGTDNSQKVVALLPGSRKQEVMKILPIMREIASSFPDELFAVAAVSNLSNELYDSIADLQNVILLWEENYNLLNYADAAIVTSGTATLETSLFEVPQVVVYKTSKINYMIGKPFVKVPFISLVNLIANKEVVKEYIQDDCNEQNIKNELHKLLHDKDYIKKMTAEYKAVKNILGDDTASEKAARLMVKYLKA